MAKMTGTPEQTREQYFAELDNYVAQPLKTQADIEAENQVAQQKYNNAKAAFDRSELGRKLWKRRKEEYMDPLLERLGQEMMQFMQTNQPSEWLMMMISSITDVAYSDNQKYKYLSEYYQTELDKHLQQY